MKVKILFLLMAILCIVSMVASCGNTTDTSSDSITDTDSDTDKSVTATYKVTVLDLDGKPMADAVVYFGTEMAFTDANGVATMTLTGSEFAISVRDLAKNEYFIGENVTVTPDKNEITVSVCENAKSLPYERVHDNGTPDEIDITDDRCAYIVSKEGKFYTDGLSSDKILFFLFIPERDGIYEFSMDIEGEIGYYAAPINALNTPIEPLADENGVLSLEIKKTNLAGPDKVATPYLIGIKPNESSNQSTCFFSIKRVSDPVYTPQDDPYDLITNPNKLEPFFISYKNWEVTLNNIDITSGDLVVVYNESDKAYHLGTVDGPTVYVRISTSSPYIDSFNTIIQTDSLSSYIYDENGSYIGKECYNALINQYYEACDKATGLYKLDKYIERAIKNHGNSVGWWNDKSSMYLFSEAGAINKENAWLFACCTVEINKNAFGSEEAPIRVEKSTSTSVVVEKVEASSGATLYVDYITIVDGTLKIENAEGVKVVYNGEEYESKNGKITVKLAGESSFQIVNTTEESKVIEFTVS